jgi:hypothetical protein
MNIVAAGARTALVVSADFAARQSLVTFEIAAAVGSGRLAFSDETGGVTLPLHGPVAWLVDFEHQRENLYDQMIAWRARHHLPVGTALPIKSVMLQPNADPIDMIEQYLLEPPVLVVRDIAGQNYEGESSYAIRHWLDVEAPKIAETHGAAVITAVSSRFAASDLAAHCDILLASKMQHAMELRLQQLKPLPGSILRLQPRRDGLYTHLVVDRLVVPA